MGSCESLFYKPDFHLSGSQLGQSDEGCGSSLDDDDASASTNVPSGIQRTVQQQVPPLVLACIEHLSLYGLNVVGIFRVSTSKKRIREVLVALYILKFDWILKFHSYAHYEFAVTRRS